MLGNGTELVLFKDLPRRNTERERTHHSVWLPINSSHQGDLVENEIEAIAWKRCIGLFLDLIPLSYSLCSSPQQIKKTEHSVYSAQRKYSSIRRAG